MTPAALLLDFGGVLADAPSGRRTPPPELVLGVYNRAAGVLTPGEIQRRLTEAAEAYRRWRDEDHPDELSQAEVWERFVLGGWPSSVQVRVRTAVKRLSYDWAWRHNWALRPGVPELLAAAAGRGSSGTPGRRAQLWGTASSVMCSAAGAPRWPR